jgi:hypothetical protein
VEQVIDDAFPARPFTTSDLVASRLDDLGCPDGALAPESASACSAACRRVARRWSALDRGGGVLALAEVRDREDAVFVGRGDGALDSWKNSGSRESATAAAACSSASTVSAGGLPR